MNRSGFTVAQKNATKAMMRINQVGAFEAKTHLSELLEKVTRGQVFCITRRGKPVAELRPIVIPDRKPHFGCDRERVKLRHDFDAPLKEMQEYTG